MKERLVDIMLGGRVVHTFPISISDPLAQTNDEAFKKKALQAAANAQLVSNRDLTVLSATMHVSRRGALQPDGDHLDVMAETKPGLDQLVRERAYSLWEQAGRPEGRAEEFWHQAQHERWRHRAYAAWQRAGSSAGNADDHWNDIRVEAP